MCKTDVYWRDWRQEEELRESATGQTRANKHTSKGSGREDGVVAHNTDAVTSKATLKMKESQGLADD